MTRSSFTAWSAGGGSGGGRRCSARAPRHQWPFPKATLDNHCPRKGTRGPGGGVPMLDLDHPDTPHVFAAARQEDFVLDCCKRITLSGAAGRLFMLEVIR